MHHAVNHTSPPEQALVISVPHHPQQQGWCEALRGCILRDMQEWSEEDE